MQTHLYNRHLPSLHFTHPHIFTHILIAEAWGRTATSFGPTLYEIGAKFDIYDENFAI